MHALRSAVVYHPSGTATRCNPPPLPVGFCLVFPRQTSFKFLLPSVGHRGLSMMECENVGVLFLCLVIAAVSLGLSPEGLEGQELRRAIARGTDRVRIFYPEGLTEGRTIPRLIRVFEAQEPVPGLPMDFHEHRRITIALATELPPGIEATSSPTDGRVVLPIPELNEWEEGELHRVMRHELAHVAMGAVLHDSTTPRWFREGFAEWVSGGLTCKGEARIRVHLMFRHREGLGVPGLSDPDLARSRLGYDYFASFFEYLEEKNPALRTGRLMTEVRKGGIEQGLSIAFGLDLSSLEADWQNLLSVRFQGLPDGFLCRG